MNKKDYDINGNRITPFRTIHKSIKRLWKNIKDSNGYYKLIKNNKENK